MRLTKMSKFFIFSIVIFLIINEVISTPLDSKFKQQQQKKKIETATKQRVATSAVQKRNDVIYPPLINSFSALILPRNVDTTLNQTEYDRRQHTVKRFIDEILKSIRNVAPLEIRTRIEKYLVEESGPNNKVNVTELSFIGNSNNHNYYNDTKSNEKLQNSKFIGADVPVPSDDDIIRRNFNDLLLKEIKRLEKLRRRRRQDNDEEDEEDDDDEDGPSGLAGLFATLSGGDEGSDVGALVGALSTLITNLFGPGGLDLSSLLSTGTSLISGLLSGDQNFGKVTAGYLTTAIDGLSGGGGAETNGLFFGNFVGGLLAGLSADPEEESEEELPPKPGLFIQSFIQGYKEAGRKSGRKGDEDESKGSDSFGFIKHIVSSIASGSTSVIVQGSVGSSGGSSQGSADASAGSSGHHPKGDGDTENIEERRVK